MGSTGSVGSKNKRYIRVIRDSRVGSSSRCSSSRRCRDAAGSRCVQGEKRCTVKFLIVMKARIMVEYYNY